MSELLKKIKNKAGMYSEESPDGGHNYIFFTQIADEIEQLEKDKALLIKENKDLKLLEDHYNRRDKINREHKALLLEALNTAVTLIDKASLYELPIYDDDINKIQEAIKQCGGEV